MNHRTIVLSTATDERATQLLQGFGILRRSWVCAARCGSVFIRLRQRGAGHAFECSKCHEQKNLKAGSFLENSNLTFIQFIDFVYFWSIGSSQDIIRQETCTSSCNTSVKWTGKFRIICEESLLRLDDGLIGGVGVEVEIDESKFSKRKYNRGRSLKDGWVFGGIERNSGRCFYEIVDDRTEKTLISVIRRRIHVGSIIYSDMWPSYQHLDLHGYTHKTVNHSENFINPETGAHTQTIESSWSHLKTYLRSKGRNLFKNMNQYFSEYLFKKRHQGQVFEALMLSISSQYTPE